jgi:hypothetical protein
MGGVVLYSLSLPSETTDVTKRSPYMPITRKIKKAIVAYPNKENL